MERFCFYLVYYSSAFVMKSIPLVDRILDTTQKPLQILTHQFMHKGNFDKRTWLIKLFVVIFLVVW